MAAVVFADEARRQQLNAIIHPLVRTKAAALMATAAPGSVVVQDIPLLVETGQGADFHLVLVVEAPAEQRVRRMLEHRAMTAEQAQERIGAQATPADRLAAADVVIDNSAGLDATLARVDRLWENRLEPFARNLAAARDGRPAGPAVLVPADPSWPAEAARLAARIRAAAGQDLVAVDHIGSTSVPGLEAKDVLDLQLRVRGLAEADRMAPALAAAGFPRFPGVWQDTPTAADPDPAHWQKRLHGAADPGRAANIHVRADGSPAARYALAFRDWLRADPDARQAYQAEKRRLAALHASDGATAGYAAGKEPWFTAVAEPGLAAWLGTSGWRAPWESETAP
jgi:dephospho-CoA kinase